MQSGGVPPAAATTSFVGISLFTGASHTSKLSPACLRSMSALIFGPAGELAYSDHSSTLPVAFPAAGAAGPPDPPTAHAAAPGTASASGSVLSKRRRESDIPNSLVLPEAILGHNPPAGKS